MTHNLVKALLFHNLKYITTKESPQILIKEIDTAAEAFLIDKDVNHTNTKLMISLAKGDYFTG